MTFEFWGLWEFWEDSENSENSESPGRNDHLFGDFCLLRFKSVRYKNSEHNSENSGGILREFWGILRILSDSKLAEIIDYLTQKVRIL